MHPKQLIGKKAIRTKHVTYAHGTIDRSFMHEPVIIKNVVQDGNGGGHIICEWELLRDKKDTILTYEYIDNNWTDYDKLIGAKPINKTRSIHNIR